MSEKQVMIVTVVILAVIVLAGLGGGYYLWFVVLDSKKKERDTVTAQVRDAEEKVKQIGKLREENATLEAAIKDLGERIPNLDRLEYDAFANLLDEKRRRANVFVDVGRWVNVAKSTAAPGRPAKVLPQTIHKVQYDLHMTGSFYQLVQFINLLEQERRFIHVESATISPGQAATGGGGGGGAAAAAAAAEAALGRRDMKLVLYSFTYKTPDLILPRKEETRKGQSTPIPE